MNLKLALMAAALAVGVTGCSPQQLIQNRVERKMDQMIGEAVDAMQDTRPAQAARVRVASYNTSLYDNADGGLIKRLQGNDANAAKIAAVIQTVRPDVVLLNEFDYDEAGEALKIFRSKYLGMPQHGRTAIDFPYAYIGPVNTGVPSGLDLDNNGSVGGNGRDVGNDAWGFGMHPGQYGMVVLSKYPIDTASIRTFQKLRWATMPGAMQPINPVSKRPWYSATAWPQMRLSSKSHWDVPINVNGTVFHLLAAHPTPPVFDGPEDRNGKRNYDEIRLWREYLNNAADNRWLCDDRDVCGGLAGDRAFVIVGDYNADPIDGDGVPGAINQVLRHPRANPEAAPRSLGAIGLAANYGFKRSGDVSLHTGDFGPKTGTLRLDYVIPSRQLRILDQGVFWPIKSDRDASLTDASDHHLVWMDLQL